ncbi:unnamed protein product, partial [Brachionus calyciflorus]
MWPGLSSDHGRARHPKSQGSVERANADIKKILATWMRVKKSTKLTIGLKDFALEELLTPPIQEEIVPIEQPAEKIVEKASLLLAIRQNVLQNQARQAEMVKKSNKRYFPDVSIVTVLNNLFARNSFDLVKDCSIEIQVKLEKQISVRQAINELSIGGGQRMLKVSRFHVNHLRPLNYQQMEREIIEWIDESRANGACLSGK